MVRDKRLGFDPDWGGRSLGQGDGAGPEPDRVLAMSNGYR